MIPRPSHSSTPFWKHQHHAHLPGEYRTIGITFDSSIGISFKTCTARSIRLRQAAPYPVPSQTGLASDLIQGHIQTLIAGCLHRHHFRFYLRMAAPDMLHYLFRLDGIAGSLCFYYDLSTHLYLYPLSKLFNASRIFPAAFSALA